MHLFLRMSVLGIVLAAVAIAGLHWPLGNEALVGLALFLALTACVYPGALLAQSAGLRAGAAELSVGVTVFLFAWLGLSIAPVWIAAGYVLHGGWDWLHHGGKIGTRIAAWFPPLCAAFDFVIASYILLAY